jgi:hypothetical protein
LIPPKEQRFPELIKQARAFCLEYGIATYIVAFRLDLPSELVDETDHLAFAMLSKNRTALAKTRLETSRVSSRNVI